MKSSFLKSKLFAAIAGILLLLVLVFLGQQLNKRYQIENEIQSMEAEIAEMEGKNQEIRELLDYFATREFKERQARSLLNLQKEGEFAVVLPQRPKQEEGDMPESREETRESNLKKWWDYFFAR